MILSMRRYTLITQRDKMPLANSTEERNLIIWMLGAFKNLHFHLDGIIWIFKFKEEELKGNQKRIGFDLANIWGRNNFNKYIFIWFFFFQSISRVWFWWAKGWKDLWPTLWNPGKTGTIFSTESCLFCLPCRPVPILWVSCSQPLTHSPLIPWVWTENQLFCCWVGKKHAVEKGGSKTNRFFAPEWW